MEWFLTRESGLVPRPCSICRPFARLGEAGGRQAYVVVTAGTVFTAAVAQLTIEALDVVFSRVAPFLSCERRERREDRVQNFFCLTKQGVLSGPPECECNAGSSVCNECSERARRFVKWSGFQQLYPNGRNHWWRGASDGVGDCFLDQPGVGERGPWLLSCRKGLCMARVSRCSGGVG